MENPQTAMNNKTEVFSVTKTISPNRKPPLGRIQDFTEGDSILGPPKAVSCRRVRGHPHPENFHSSPRKCDFRRLRPSHGVLRSRFFQPSFFFSLDWTILQSRLRVQKSRIVVSLRMLMMKLDNCFHSRQSVF